MKYKTSEEYWKVIEENYRAFSNGGDPVEVVDALHKPDGECELCGHPITNRFIIENRRNGSRITVGNRCVHNRVTIERKWWNKIRREREEASGQAVLGGAG